MTTSMIDRIADAIPAREGGGTLSPYELAETALQALATPTEAMLEAGGMAYVHPSVYQERVPHTVRRKVAAVWLSMITEAKAGR